MRVLIVEDNEAKKDNIIRLLEKEGITDYKTEKFVTKVFQKVRETQFSLLITDLGIPRFIDNPIVEDVREGLKMMYDLAYEDIKIPTIIYSKTEIYDEQVEYLEEIEYPFLGQARSVESLEKMIKNFAFNKKWKDVLWKKTIIGELVSLLN